MKMARFFANLVTATAMCSMVVTPALSQQVVGVNTAVRNNVQVKQNASASAQKAVVKQRVTLGNQVQTGGASSLQVTLLDRTTFTVGPNAKFTVDKFVYDPAKKKSSVGATVAKGTFRMLSGKSTKGGGNTVSTPAATIGIRGTMLEGSVGADALAVARAQGGLAGLAGADPETATLIVLRGPGPQAPDSETRGEISVTSGGKTVVVNTPGQAVFVPFPGAAPIVFTLSNAAFSRFDMSLRTAPQSFAQVQSSLQQASNSGNAGSSSGSSGSSGSSAGSGTGTGGAGGGAGAGAGAGGVAGATGIAGLSTFSLLGLLAAVSAVITATSLSDSDDRPISA